MTASGILKNAFRWDNEMIEYLFKLFQKFTSNMEYQRRDFDNYRSAQYFVLNMKLSVFTSLDQKLCQDQ